MTETEALLAFARTHHVTVAACESLTAGLFMATLASVPGASTVLRGGFVTYTNEMKQKLAHVEAGILNTEGAVSAACAAAMASHTRELTGADYAVSFTGNAGPSALEDKPAGLVYCAIDSRKRNRVCRYEFAHMSRNEVREAVVEAMVTQLLAAMKEELNGQEI